MKRGTGPRRPHGAALRGARGFTLLELLVAITILALIAVFSWRGLDQVVRTREVLAQQQAVLDAGQRLFARLARDINRARAVEVDASGRVVFSVPVPGQAARVTLVEYVLSDGRLLRRDAGGLGDEVVIDAGVEAWLGAVRLADGGWGATPQQAPPASGLRVMVRLAGVGTLQRVFLLRE